jgi:enoyl-CoA hydratase
METLRTETSDGVRSIVLCRADAYNTITPQLRDELSQAIDDAEFDRDVRVILLRADGPAFCAGYGFDWAIDAATQELAQGVQGGEAAAQRAAGERSQMRSERSSRVWDSVADLRMLGPFVDTFMKLWYAKKPTIAAVQGWCIGGRHRHGPVRRPDRGGRGRPLRVSAVAGLGDADDGHVGVPDGP